MLLRTVGTVVRGIRTPIIKENDKERHYEYYQENNPARRRTYY